MRKLLLLLLLALPAAADEGVFFFLPPAAVFVGTSAVAIASNSSHSFVEVCNADASKTLSVGFSSAVTTTTGRPVLPGDSVRYNQLLKGQTLYGITTSGTVSAVITEALPSGR